MISWRDLYEVLTAVVPLYVAMILAYGSVRWWKIFSPDQCAGINRFVAIFAVPLLSLHFISTNNIYQMNFHFIAADTLQKLIMLIALVLWANVARSGRLDWAITIFSLTTLPNTLVMGIPLLRAMYRGFSGDAGGLMVQVVVLQCIVWYTILLFLFEYRAARNLIAEQFPQIAANIVSFRVDADVVSFDGADPLEANAELDGEGKLHVTVRKSNASRVSFPCGVTPRASNLTGAEIYSLSSSRNATPRASNFNNSDFYCAVGFPGGRLSNFGPADVYSFQPSRQSNFEEGGSPALGLGPHPAPNRMFSSEKSSKELRKFRWSSGASSSGELGFPQREDEINELDNRDGVNEALETHSKGHVDKDQGKMPRASVMTRLILIMVWRKLIRNPNTYSSVIGLVWSLVCFRWSLTMPKLIIQSISILSDAGLGMAMFSLGLFMALQPKIIACGNKQAAFAMAARFLTGPAVMAAASIVVGLRGTLLHVAIVQAALPQGIVPFVFAKEYNVHPALLSTGVIFGMLIALPITLVYYILLGL